MSKRTLQLYPTLNEPTSFLDRAAATKISIIVVLCDQHIYTFYSYVKGGALPNCKSSVARDAHRDQNWMCPAVRGRFLRAR